MKSVFAIDPGSRMSAYCVVQEGFQPDVFGKVQNEELIRIVKAQKGVVDAVVIEQVASYGMPVGLEVFTTCEWIGRFKQIAINNKLHTAELFRKDVTVEVCGSAKAGDSNVRRALIDRFAKHDFVNGKGTRGNPDWFHGFAADVWSAYAIGYTYMIKRGRGEI